MVKLKQPITSSAMEKADYNAVKSEYSRQFLAAFLSCLAAISAGAAIGYASPAFPDMIDRKNIPITDDDKSWAGSILNVGALVGGLSAGAAIDHFGRRTFLIYMSLPFIAGWFCITFAKTMVFVYVGRFLTGLCVGIACLNTSVYMSEIASAEVRGILGSGFQLFINVGILLAYVVGAYVSWIYLALFCMVWPLLLMACMIPMPESPVWLLRKNRLAEAAKALKWLRGEDYDVMTEVENLHLAQHSEDSVSIREFSKPSLWKPLLLMEIQMFLQQFSGINAVLFNAVDIFASANTAIDEKLSAIILPVVMVIASIVASLLMDVAGRRVLMLVSAVLQSASLIILGVYYYLKETDPQAAASVSWVPLLCLVVFCFVFNIGFGPIPWLMMGELFPGHARGLASSIITASNWTMAFIITLSFKAMTEALHSYGVFWFFGIICGLGAVFIWFKLPETKGKSLEQIQMLFK